MDFRLQVFSWISVSRAPKYSNGAILNFFENSRRYTRINVHHQCQRHRPVLPILACLLAWVPHNSCRSEGFTMLTGLHASALHREEFFLIFLLCEGCKTRKKFLGWCWGLILWNLDLWYQITNLATCSLSPYSKKMDDFFYHLKGLSHEIFRAFFFSNKT
jgi:hypothetical protein